MALTLIILVSVVFDITEKLDDFISRHAPWREIVFDYYVNFIPNFANLFTPLFVFIAVIFFTGKMAMQTEIVAILNSGVSFRRLMLPYILCATLIASLNFYFNGWVIPHSNKTRLEFENKYINNPAQFKDRNFHRQISPGVFLYIETYNTRMNIGTHFSIEKIKNGNRYYYLNSDQVTWDSIKQNWRIDNYYIRTVDGMKENLTGGMRMDTVLPISPKDFKRRDDVIDAMDSPSLNAFIHEQELQGSAKINTYLNEKYRRIAGPFSTFILTLIGLSLSSRKVRGGIGLQIGIGMLLSFTYILFMQITKVFSESSLIPPLVAMWLPNVIFLGIAFLLVRYAPK
jgi:lipopolysaccharide export system permease protein